MPLPTLYSKDSVDNLLADKLDLAGGTMTGGLTLSATGIIFSDATTLTTAPAGGTLAADQLTAGVVATNPAAGPTTAGDVLQYDGTDLIWAAGGGGTLAADQLTAGVVATNPAAGPTTANDVLTYDGTDLVWAAPVASVAWGGITGTLSTQTDLQTALDGKLAAPSVNSQTSSYTLASGDANNVIFCPAGTFITLTVPKDATYSFPIGTNITVVVDGSSSCSVGFASEDAMTPAPVLLGYNTAFSATTVVRIIKVAADLWVFSY